MAEQIVSSRSKGRTGKRMIKKSTTVDLAPMVDLGFLLIIFFVFTTTMSSTTAMGMNTPNDSDSSVTDDVCNSCAITVIAGAGNRLFYYQGSENSAVYRSTDYSANGLRKLLSEKKQVVQLLHKDAVLIIKPGDSSNFKNLINIIDESTIAMYKRYYIDELSETDRRNVKRVDTASSD